MGLKARLTDIANKIGATFSKLWKDHKSDLKLVLMSTAGAGETLLGELWRTYKPQILQLVLGIATGAISGGSKQDLFADGLKKILDASGDGHLHFNDISGNSIDWLRATAVAFMRGMGSSDTEQIAGLTEYLRDFVPGGIHE